MASNEATMAILQEMKENDMMTILEGTFRKDNVLELVKVEKTKTQAEESKPELKRKWTEFSSAKRSDQQHLETQTITVQSINFSKYKDPSCSRVPLMTPLKLLFLGATDSLTSAKKSEVVWKKARFLSRILTVMETELIRKFE